MTAGTGPSGDAGRADAHGAGSAPRRHAMTFAAKPDQVGAARRFLAGILNGCPATNEAILVASELASNCVVHSASPERSGTFTVAAEIQDGELSFLFEGQRIKGRPVEFIGAGHQPPTGAIVLVRGGIKDFSY